MASEVALGAAMRANLLSLQKTNALLDTTQFRLSTGRKINSALDGAQSFFAAQSLTNRAGDLSRLLDGMGQSIQTIKQADKSVTAMTKLVEQADSIAQQARDEVSTTTQEAKIVGNANLKGVTNIDSLAGIDNGDTIVFKAYNADGTVAFNTKTVTLATDDSIEQVVAKINDVNQGLTENVIEAKLNDSGQLEIKGLNGANFTMKFETTGTAESVPDNLAMATALGFGSIAESVADGTEAANAQQYDVRVTALATPSITSVALYRDNSTEFARASDAISSAAAGASGLRTAASSTAAGTAVFNRGAAGADDNFIVGYNGKTASIAVSTSTTLQGLIDGINNDATLKGKIEATYDGTTGKLNIRAVDASVTTIQFGISEETDGETSTARFGFGLGAFGADATDIASTSSGTADPLQNVESFRLGASAGNLAKLEQDYNKLRTQIDQLAEDAGYRGTNLLNGDSLLTVFNEDRTTSLTTNGVIFSADGLGLSTANFANAARTDGILTEVRAALGSVRNFGASLANDLAVMQTREDFTKETIQTLTEGADKLTLADQNEEGARMLALQTRLQLGVTSLSLAAQSQQSVLSLF